MQYILPDLLIVVFSGLPLLGVFIPEYQTHDNLRLEGFYVADLIHCLITVIGSVLCVYYCKNKKLWWGEYKDLNYEKTMKNIMTICIILTILTFLTYGKAILSGTHRGVVRTSVGGLGWLSTFSQGYGMRSVLALSTIYYFYLSINRSAIVKQYVIILCCGLFGGIMSGGKANIIFAMLPVLIQSGEFLNYKKIAVIAVFGVLSVFIIGMAQMNMSFEESIIYNIYRATDLASYGSMCMWDKYPNGAEQPYLVILTSSLGENITSFLTGIDRHSVDFLKYSFSRAITYEYYNNYLGAVDGTVNLTVTPLGEGVFWFGRNFYFLVSLIGVLIFKFIVNGFYSSAARGKIVRNVVFTNFLITFILWLTTSQGFVLSLFIGMTALVYLFLVVISLKFMLKRAKIVKVKDLKDNKE